MIIVIIYNDMLNIRSALERKVINYFLNNPEQEKYVNELAALLKLDPGNLCRKLAALASNGILVFRVRGKEKFFRLNKTSPLLPAFKKIFGQQYGLAEEIKKALQKLAGIQEAYIFGSFASNTMNAESDIDLLLIGKHSALAAERAILPLQTAIQREINIVDFSPEEYDKRKKTDDAFIKTLFSRKTIKLI